MESDKSVEAYLNICCSLINRKCISAEELFNFVGLTLDEDILIRGFIANHFQSCQFKGDCGLFLLQKKNSDLKMELNKNQRICENFH